MRLNGLEIMVFNNNWMWRCEVGFFLSVYFFWEIVPCYNMVLYYLSFSYLFCFNLRGIIHFLSLSHTFTHKQNQFHFSISRSQFQGSNIAREECKQTSSEKVARTCMRKGGGCKGKINFQILWHRVRREKKVIDTMCRGFPNWIALSKSKDTSIHVYAHYRATYIYV